jgi:hypothetical protein
MVAYWERVLNGLVYELYFPEELHTAGLRLFDLVASADLPDVTALPEADRPARGRPPCPRPTASRASARNSRNSTTAPTPSASPSTNSKPSTPSASSKARHEHHSH